MSAKKFVVNIEGDYVDSYIYSGLLMLVDMDYRINIYKWESLCAQASSGINILQKISVDRLLSDSRNKVPGLNVSEVTITKRMLNSARLFTHKIGVWPSDISVYSNKLYVSSECGLSIHDFDYKTGVLSGESKIFDEMCFSVSPNSFNRVAFAAGKEGVFTMVPLAKMYGKKDVKQLVSGTCVDIDWQSTLLFATMDKGVVEVAFNKMPNKKSFVNKKDFFSEVKKTKLSKPDVSVHGDIHSSWIGGNKKYYFYESGLLVVEAVEHDEPRSELNIDLSEKVIRARTAAFGTAVETDKNLYALIGSTKTLFAEEPISWRVFPRAKNYANQLHVVQGDRVEIVIIESTPDNVLGFNTECIDLQG